MTREHSWRAYGAQETLCGACGFVAWRPHFKDRQPTQEEIDEGIDDTLREHNWSRDCSGQHHVRGKIIARRKSDGTST